MDNLILDALNAMSNKINERLDGMNNEINERLNRIQQRLEKLESPNKSQNNSMFYI